METSSVRCLINSISRFIHLVSCQTIKPMPILKDYREMFGVLKLLKPVLDDVVNHEIIFDEVLYKECEALDILVNEAREFMENCSPKLSKICSVLQSEVLLMKIRISSLEICGIICKLLQSSPSSSSLSAVQHCMQSLQFPKQETLSEIMEEALKSRRDNTVTYTKHLKRITELLSLASNQELLKETIAVEKERTSAKSIKSKQVIYYMDQIVDLITCLRDWMGRNEQFQGISGVSVPPYFRCPLSSELMIDPVIVASGQTYDRSSINKWLDNGLTFCPNTRQVLTHTNLIPNYTVKAMIDSWCEENKIELSGKFEKNFACQQDSTCLDSHSSVQNSNFKLTSSFQVRNRAEKQNSDASSRLSGEKSKGCQNGETEKSHHQSQEQSCVHSRSGSTSSAISSVEYVPSAINEILSISKNNGYVSEPSGEITSEFPAAASRKESGLSPELAGKLSQNSKIQVMAENGNNNYEKGRSRSTSVPECDTLTTTSHVKELIIELTSQKSEVQTDAAEELRLLAKHNMQNRVIIGQCGAIVPLLSLLYSDVKMNQEHAVTALLNLSIDENNKAIIAQAGAIEPLIHVLKTGNDGAKENSAAALFSLSVLEEYKAKIGRSGAVKVLVDLLGSGTLRGKKDAATALFNLSIFHENKARIVKTGAVKYLVELLDPANGMVDKAAALLANLSTIEEGRLGIVREGGIPSLVEIVETGSLRGRENAASILLQLCLHSSKFCTLILQEGAVPPLVALSQSGTPRAKEKAQQLLSHFRNQREGGSGKGKS